MFEKLLNNNSISAVCLPSESSEQIFTQSMLAIVQVLKGGEERWAQEKSVVEERVTRVGSLQVLISFHLKYYVFYSSPVSIRSNLKSIALIGPKSKTAN